MNRIQSARPLADLPSSTAPPRASAMMVVGCPHLLYILNYDRHRNRTCTMPVTHEPWLVALSLIVAIQGFFRRTEPGRASRRGRRGPAAGIARRRGDLARGGHLGDAFRRDAGGAAAVPGGLSGPADAVVVPDLRDRGRDRRLHRQRRAFDAVAPRRLRLPDGRRHRDDALHRHGSAACECSHAARSALRRVEHGRRHRRVRLGALAGRRPGAPAAAHPVGGRLRRGHLGDALHRHGRADAVSARAACRRAPPRCPAISSPSS